jgi:uncharacterized protein YecT (DUF1311 family)
MLQRLPLILLATCLVTLADAQTESGINRQAHAEFERTDAALKATYEELLTRLPDGESKRKLLESQRAWIAFRDAEACFAADQVRGGTAAPAVRYASMKESTEQRIKQLKRAFRP